MKMWVLHITTESSDHYFAISENRLSDEATKRLVALTIPWEVEIWEDDGADWWGDGLISGEWHEAEVHRD
jgi:hypothetical protein